MMPADCFVDKKKKDEVYFSDASGTHLQGSSEIIGELLASLEYGMAHGVMHPTNVSCSAGACFKATRKKKNNGTNNTEQH